MHSIKFIKNNPRKFDEEMKKRGTLPLAHEILKMDAKIKNAKQKIQKLNHEKKTNAKNIAVNKETKNTINTKLAETGEEIAVKIQHIQKILLQEQQYLQGILDCLPNITHEDVPFGNKEENNVLMKIEGKQKTFNFNIKSHEELGIDLHGIDIQQTVKNSGPRFATLRNQLALLERALINFMLDHNTNLGYEEISPPALVKNETMYKAGQLPKFDTQLFTTNKHLRLIPTGEVPLVTMVADKILQEKDLPIKFTACTPCFRLEAGSSGKDTKGLIRLHQFPKVEIVNIVTPQESDKALEDITSIAEQILQKLEIPYRRMLLCSQDMGFGAYKTYDIEAWMPHQNKYTEISSCSHCNDFQSLRMNTKYKNSNKETIYPHTLNGSALAVGRTIAALLENHQQKDGSIAIPKALQKYMQNKTTINKP